jgi:hypothetical protein
VRGDDDSAVDDNARIAAKLVKGRGYVARLRLYWTRASGQTPICPSDVARRTDWLGPRRPRDRQAGEVCT